eukprot:gene17074-biopygen17305
MHSKNKEGPSTPAHTPSPSPPAVGRGRCKSSASFALPGIPRCANSATGRTAAARPCGAPRHAAPSEPYLAVAGTCVQSARYEPCSHCIGSCCIDQWG